MFRIIVELNNPKVSADNITVFDKVWKDFTDFKIDVKNIMYK